MFEKSCLSFLYKGRQEEKKLDDLGTKFLSVNA